MSDLLIPDVSSFQGDVDWINFGSDAVICRINYGNNLVDAKADKNIDGARSRCKARGWYTYLIGSEDPVAQADVLVRVLNAHGGLQPNEFIVCDDEEGSGAQSGRIDQFLNEVDAQLRVNKDVDWWYSGLTFSLAHNLQAAIGHRWIAAYGQGEPSAAHDLWQFTDAASIAGVSGNVDMSIFHGDISQFISFIGGSQPINGEGGMGYFAFRPGGPNDRWDMVFTVKNTNVNGGVSIGHAWGDSIPGISQDKSANDASNGYEDCGAPTLPAGVSLVSGTAEIFWNSTGSQDVVWVQASDGSWWMFSGNLTAVDESGWQRASNYDSLVPMQGPPGPATFIPHTHKETGSTDSGTPN